MSGGTTGGLVGPPPAGSPSGSGGGSPGRAGADPDGGGQGPRPTAWVWVAIALVCAALSPVAAALSRSTSGASFAVWVVLQAVVTALAFAIPQIRQVASERRQASAEEGEFEARVDTVVRMNDALDPIVRLLGRVALEPDPITRGEIRAQALPLVLKTAAELIGPTRARACWFALEPGPPKRLVPTEFAGRAGPPTTLFVEGTLDGDAAIGMVLDDGERQCDDVLAVPPPGFDLDRRRDYRAFVAVSVIAADTAYGMLTLDALEPGDLSGDDMRLLRLMSGALAVAMSIR